jgi:hypothetical protein
MELTDRLRQRIARDYQEDDRESVESILAELMGSLKEDDKERIVAAALLRARGQTDRLLLLVQMAQRDWRDVLMHSGLEHDDWADRMDAEFGAGPRGTRGWRKFRR